MLDKKGVGNTRYIEPLLSTISFSIIKIRCARTGHHPRYTPKIVSPVLSQFHKHFPDAFTGKELEEGGGGPFNSNFNGLSVGNVAVSYPSVHLLDEFCSSTEMIENKETLQNKPLLNRHQQVRRSNHSLVVARDHAAQRKGCEVLRRCQGRVHV